MKARVLLVFALLLVHPTVSAQTPAPMRESKINLATTTPTSTEKNINKVDKAAENLEQLDQSFTLIIFFLAKVLAVSLIIVVIYRIFFPIVKRPPQLIIDNFNNATGITEMDPVLPGLRQLAREKLIQEMSSAHQQMKEKIEKIEKIKDKNEKIKKENEEIKKENEEIQEENNNNSFQTTNTSSSRQNIPDKILTNFISSWLKFTPEQLESTMKILKIMFPPQGTKVTSILQSQGSKHRKLGITFEISDLQGKIASKIYTVWESGEYQSPQPDLKDRYRKLLQPSMHLLARELYCREMEIAAPQAHKAQVRDFCKSTLELEKLHGENVRHE